MQKDPKSFSVHPTITEGDLTQVFPTFQNPIVNLDFYVYEDDPRAVMGVKW